MIKEFIMKDISHNLIGVAAVLVLIWLVATVFTLLYIVSKVGRADYGVSPMEFPISSGGVVLPMGTGVAGGGRYRSLMAAKDLTIFLSKLYVVIEGCLFVLAFIYI